MTEEKQRVVVTDLDISFFQLVWLMIKISFASIPAMIIVSVIMSGVMAVMFSIFMALGVLGAAAAQ